MSTRTLPRAACVSLPLSLSQSAFRSPEGAEEEAETRSRPGTGFKPRSVSHTTSKKGRLQGWTVLSWMGTVLSCAELGPSTQNLPYDRSPMALHGPTGRPLSEMPWWGWGSQVTSDHRKESDSVFSFPVDPSGEGKEEVSMGARWSLMPFKHLLIFPFCKRKKTPPPQLPPRPPIFNKQPLEPEPKA